MAAEEATAAAPGKRRRGSEQTCADLLDAALVIWSRSGRSSVTMDAVAREAGRTRGIVYHHFADRQALIDAARDHLHQQLAGLFASPGPDANDPYHFVPRLVVESPELILTYVQELAMRDPREDRVVATGIKHFQRLAAAGRLARGVDPAQAAIVTIGLWFSAVVAANLGTTLAQRRSQSRAFAETYRIVLEHGLLRGDTGLPCQKEDTKA